MISIPKFILQKESSAALWIGLVFFSMLMLLLLFHGVLPFLPRPAEKKQSDEIPPELKKLEIPEEIVKSFTSTTQDIKKPDPQFNYWEHASSLISAIVLVFWPIVPLGRELRQRHLSKCQMTQQSN